MLDKRPVLIAGDLFHQFCNTTLYLFFCFLDKQKTYALMSIGLLSSPSRTRTYDSAVNSRVLYRLSYRGMAFSLFYYTLKTTHYQHLFYIFLPSSLPDLPVSVPGSFGQALDLLVAVSSIHYCTSTSALSTSSSSRGLTACAGISHLEGGFTLRCLQRLSTPNTATRLCR